LSEAAVRMAMKAESGGGVGAISENENFARRGT